MPVLRHLTCGYLQKPPNPRVVCHCLVLEGPGGLTLVDTGIGLLDVRDPVGRVSQPVIDAAGFEFNEADTAVRQLERLGRRPADVTHVILTHGDPDHAGGLADFPGATVHLAAEEHAAIAAGNPRYRPPQFAHGPRWRTYGVSTHRWFGMEARPLDLESGTDVLLVPLFGHTRGHCGVAVARADGWDLHVGDAYYLRVELLVDDHPVSVLAALRAEDDAARRTSLGHVRRLHREQAGAVRMFGYHDPDEFRLAAGGDPSATRSGGND